MKSFTEFAAAMRARESSGRYDCVNEYGYLGAYQFGLARLSDFGIVNRGGVWQAGLSPPAFLADTELQDRLFVSHVARLAAVIRSRYRDKLATISLSGAIAVAHLLGLGGLASYFRGEDSHDALGTTAAEYYNTFSGYDIPADLPVLLKGF